MTETPAGSTATADVEQSTPGRRRPRAGWIWAAIAVLLVGAVIAVWALGGFAQQIRRYETVAVGSPVTAGPYVFTFTKATVQRQPATSYREGSVKVLVIGTARTTAEESLTPSVGSSGMFLAYDKATNLTQDATAQRLGDGGPSSFTPGLPDIDYQVEFSFPADFRAGEQLSIGIAQQEYGSNALIQTGDDEKTWHNDAGYGFQIALPVTVLPDAKP